jgi:hypothetical protein
MRKAKAVRVGIGVGAGGCLEAAPSAVVVVVVVVASTVRLRWPGVAMVHAPTTTRLLHHPSLTFIISLNTTTKRKTHTLNHCSLSLSLSLYQSTHQWLVSCVVISLSFFVLQLSMAKAGRQAGKLAAAADDGRHAFIDAAWK